LGIKALLLLLFIKIGCAAGRKPGRMLELRVGWVGL
jgi:hypothetical protein